MPMESSSEMQTEARLTSGVYAKRELCLTRGEGCRVWDDQGRSYLDFIAGIGTRCLGHCPPAVVEAIRRQAGRLISCSELFYNDARANLLERLDAITPDAYRRFFLCNSGTEAIEGAMKFSRLTTGRKKFVAFDRAFHGRTMGALSATAKKAIREPFLPLLHDVLHVPFDSPDALLSAVDGDTAAVLFEPIQGEGGIYEMSPGMAGALRQAAERGAMLIADEIQAGVFRTGRAFAHQHFEGLEPDFVCMAKALGGGVPIGAIAIGRRVKELPKGSHGTTYGGTPLMCAAAEAVLRTIEEQDLAARNVRMGKLFRDGLRDLGAPCVTEVRGRGLMIGVQLNCDAKPVIQQLQERGLLLLGAGENCLRMLPPYVVTEEELEEALEHIGAVLRAVEPVST